jgi:putative ABC transport system substrate-binding protein
MNSSNPLGPLQLEEAQKAARMLSVQLITLNARNAAELDAALHTLSRTRADGLLVTAALMLQANKSKIAKAVRQARLPTMVPYRNYLDAGTLISYGPDVKDLMRRVAGYVDRTLKGAKPSDLPIEQVSKYELVIDLRAARALGINVPQELLFRADEVIRRVGSLCCSRWRPPSQFRPFNVRLPEIPDPLPYDRLWPN